MKKIMKLGNNYVLAENDNILKDGKIIATTEDFVDAISTIEYDPQKGGTESICYEAKALPCNDVLEKLQMEAETWFNIACIIAEKIHKTMSFA